MSLARLSAVPTDTSRPTAHPPAGRSAHPSVHPSSGPHIPDGPDSDRQAPDHRRGDRIRPVGAVSFRALRAIAAGLARVEQPLPVDLAGDGPRSSRLIATAFYDVWLITWPDGSGLEPHDHGDVRSVLQVVDGDITEVYRDRRANLEPASRVLGQGSVTLAEPTVVHSLRNRSGAEATTLHVYSPPLVDVTFFDLHPAGACEAVRSTPVVATPAQATSEGVAVPGPRPLSQVQP